MTAVKMTRLKLGEVKGCTDPSSRVSGQGLGCPALSWVPHGKQQGLQESAGARPGPTGCRSQGVVREEADGDSQGQGSLAPPPEEGRGTETHPRDVTEVPSTTSARRCRTGRCLGNSTRVQRGPEGRDESATERRPHV